MTNARCPLCNSVMGHGHPVPSPVTNEEICTACAVACALLLHQGEISIYK